MHFARLHLVAAAAVLTSGPAVVSAGAHARRGVECFFEFPADSGETCESLSSSWGIPVDEFIDINPGVTCPNLDAGKNYCVVGEFTPEDPTTPPTQPSPTTSTSTRPTTTTQPPTTLQTSTTTTAATGPTVSPIMPGAAANCDRYYQVQSGDSCDAIAQKNGITVAQLKSWNTDINASCSNLWLDYYVCTRVPGAVVPTTTLRPSTTTAAATGPTVSPVMPGAAANCDRYYKIQSGDSCDVVASKNGITVAQLRSWNTDINAGCSNLWLDYYVCTRIPDSTTPTTTAKTTTTTAAAAGPTVSPVMPGVVANCDRYYKVQSGDSCDAIAQKNGITVAQLKTWNTDINAGCSNLWLDYYICTRVPGAVTPTTTAKTTTAPGPTNTPQLPGAVGNCNMWYKIASGDTCDNVAAKNKITVAMLRSYNTQINSSCNNLLKDYYACVGIPGAATPMPGIVSNCSRFYKVASGDSCDVIASKAGITVANFRKWNSQINSGCSNLWLDALVCTNA
ncbi:LysM domain-containing protein-like protein 4 [Colletotrichum chlorophyti]|uniref:LysM domain-containing protein-like protein 4 n=1 Tax=Colletotrichum chlorophyti TaxID=708187 RepID=A0A1Q8S5M4_9PEZI|nr:LysM domain-containing protein-like protein 4 [Colletotrichum chlorophyti]